MLSDSELNSFANLSRISDEDIMEEDEEDVEESLTHKQTLRVDVTWKTFSIRRHFKSSSYTGLKVNHQLVAYATRFLAVCLKNHVWSHHHAFKAKVRCDFSSADHTTVLRLINNFINILT